MDRDTATTGAGARIVQPRSGPSATISMPSHGPLPAKANPRAERLTALAIIVSGAVATAVCVSPRKMLLKRGQLKAMARTRKTGAIIWNWHQRAPNTKRRSLSTWLASPATVWRAASALPTAISTGLS